MDVNNYVHSYCHNVINNVTLLLNIIEQNIKCTAEQIHTERISTITEMLASMMLNSMLSAFQQLKCLPALLLKIIEQNKCTAGQIHAERISTSEVLASMMLNSMLSAFQ